MSFFGMGPLEIVLILALALVVFGPNRLPELARQLGKTVGEVRRITAEVTGEVNRSLQLEDQPPSAPSRAAVVRPVPSPTVVNQSGERGTLTPSHDDLQPPY